MQRTTAAATSTPIASTASSVQRVRGLLSPRSTPGGFRLAAAVATVVCALCGILAASAISARSGSIDSAARAAEQLVGVQEIRVAAVEADSIAASSYLADSVGQAVLRGDYEKRLGDATRLLTEVTQRAPVGDVEALATANGTLTTFAGLVEQARANNLQGFPVGAAYQRQASALVTDPLLPALDAVDLASRQRLNDALSDSTRNGVIAIVLLLVALIALVVASWVLFRRTRRILNVPVAVGAALVLVALLWSAFTLLPTGRTIDDTVDTSLRGADALSRARASAFDARRAESLTLVNRGTGAAYEADWATADEAVVTALDEACASAGECFDEPWEAYQVSFAEVRRLDNEDGNYDGAVELSLGPAADQFRSFADATGAAQETRVGQVTSGFEDARGPLGLLRWGVLLAGLAAAAAVVVGFGQRLREYR